MKYLLFFPRDELCVNCYSLDNAMEWVEQYLEELQRIPHFVIFAV